MLARTAVGTASKSPFAQTTKARSVKVKLNRKVLYELDGGDRTKVKSFKVKVEPDAVTVCVPAAAQVAPSDLQARASRRAAERAFRISSPCAVRRCFGSGA